MRLSTLIFLALAVAVSSSLATPLKLRPEFIKTSEVDFDAVRPAALHSRGLLRFPHIDLTALHNSNFFKNFGGRDLAEELAKRLVDNSGSAQSIDADDLDSLLKDIKDFQPREPKVRQRGLKFSKPDFSSVAPVEPGRDFATREFSFVPIDMMKFPHSDLLDRLTKGKRQFSEDELMLAKRIFKIAPTLQDVLKGLRFDRVVQDRELEERMISLPGFNDKFDLFSKPKGPLRILARDLVERLISLPGFNDDFDIFSHQNGPFRLPSRDDIPERRSVHFEEVPLLQSPALKISGPPFENVAEAVQ